MALLSILIPTLESRGELLRNCLDSLNHKDYKDKVEILLEYDNGEYSIGAKRNILLDRSIGKYVCFIDDDDIVATSYLKNIFEGIAKGVDCCSLRGIITFNGNNPEYFEHSIRYNEYKTTDNTIKYERYPNHLNCIKSSIAKQFRFADINHGEDTDWATQIHKSGLIKIEHYINDVMYHYKFITNK